ncbi:hypothetical protein PLEOSDRAFT_167688 [Pleurotus ostreatus PC15]|uniref:Uncharacterized protein n=1 Tax=Pleurotus ostreatus (strain PC15) TaxID=1137138 RepID=A0A067P213_PLEO1|nr:hypothetical protein PLEOSDRAFT_167688 [Pleurotus ostreatus PC15]
MAPPSKVTVEQKAYLTGLLDQFLEAQKHGRLDKFWPMLSKGWFEQWPAHEDTEIADEDERKRELRERLSKRQVYLKRWYHNRTALKTRGSHVKPLVVQPVKIPRRPQLVQLYIKKYYKSKIRPLIYAQVPAGGKLTRTEFLAALHDIAPKALEKESDEVKREITDLYEAMHHGKEGTEDEATPAMYAAAITELPRQFAAIGQELARRTGWSFTLLAGGPDPINGGRLNSIGIHLGENSAGLSFGKANPHFSNSVLNPYAEFLSTVYTQAECDARSLIPCGGLATTGTLAQALPATVPDLTEASSCVAPPPSVSDPSSTLISIPPQRLDTEQTSAINSFPPAEAFDWSEFDQCMAQFNVSSTIPDKATGAALGQTETLANHPFHSLLDELNSKLPGLVASPSHLPSPPIAFPDCTTNPLTAFTAPDVPPVPTVPLSDGIEPDSMSTTTTPTTTPTITTATTNATPMTTTTTTTITATPTTTTMPITTATTTTDTDATITPIATATTTTTMATATTTITDTPTVPTCRPKRARPGEDPSMIVSGKRERRQIGRKEVETITKEKEKEKKRKKKHA